MYRYFLMLLFAFFLFTLSAQELSSGYKDIKLGMSKDEVADLIGKSYDFYDNRNEVLTIRLEPDTEIITAEGRGFIEIGYFHFHEDKLFQIFLIFNEKVGYYTLLKRLTDKFGSPTRLDPKNAFWQEGDVKIVIEKPGKIKYLYLPIWNSLLNSDLSDRKILDQQRDSFVDDL